MNLLDAARPAAERLQQLPRDARVRVVAHPDADGVASAAILVRTLQRLGRVFHVTYGTQHGPGLVDALPPDPYDAHIFVDVGAEALDAIARLPGLRIVLDHHPPGPAPHDAGPHFFHVNPHLIGIDGSRSACAATVCLAFAITVSPLNWDAAPIALAGVWGDRQDRPAVQGWNQEVLEEASRRRLVESRTHLSGDDWPLVDLFEYPIPPWTQAGPADEPVDSWLRRHGLPGLATPLELSTSEAETLASLLTTRLLRAGFPAHDVGLLFQVVPASPRHGALPLPRVASLVTAAAREHEPGLGLSFLLDDASAKAELENLEGRYREKIRQALRRLRLDEVRTLGALHLFKSPDPNYISEVTAMARDRLLAPTHVTLGFGGSPKVHCSARAPPDLLARGVHVGHALSRAARECGGEGGGDSVAAGARVPEESFERFVKIVDDLIVLQMKG